AKKRLYFADGTSEPYEILISTMPLDLLVLNSNLDDLKPATRLLKHSSSNIVGLGLKGAPPPALQRKCWMYFPENNCPFYRVTVFSNYSPHNVPDIDKYWSLMLEVSESPCKPVNRAAMIEEVISGALNTRLIESKDQVVSTWMYHAPYGYPTPSLERDQALDVLLPALGEHDIYSRGRFGAWKYEVSNQDHSVMQGVECVNNVLFGTDEVTVFHPTIVNGR
ncbi:MAG: amine oxidase, partial [Chloroflexota bacterium]|nr:amine oxidase [Chloroflexota bacterium]